MSSSPETPSKAKRRHRRTSEEKDDDAAEAATLAPALPSVSEEPSGVKSSPLRRVKHSSLPPATASTTAGASTEQQQQQQQSLEQQLQSERSLRQALEVELATLLAELKASKQTLRTELQRVLAAHDAKLDALVERLSTLTASSPAAMPAPTGAAPTPASPGRFASPLAASASMPLLPLTPGDTPTKRASSSTTSSQFASLSPEVKGLIGELELLDSELERRRGGSSGLRLGEPPPIASLAPNALADDDELETDTGSASSVSMGSVGNGAGRKALVAAMLALEEDFLDSVGATLKGYWEPMVAMAEANASVVSLQDIGDIFLSLKQIYDSHRQLKLQLADRARDWQNDTEIGDILCELPELFEPYNEFVVGSDAAQELLSRCLDDRAFNALVERLRHERRELRGRSLVELLRLPLKRIDQYVPQLVKLVAATNESHPDYGNMVRALNYMRAFEADVHAAARQRDKMLEIKSLVADFQGLVLPNRVFLREGALIDMTDAKAGKGKQLHLFLFNDLLIACVPQKHKPLMLKSRAQSHKPYKFVFKIDIDSTTTIVEEIQMSPEATAAAAAASLASEGPTNLILKAFDRTVILQAQNGAERAAWAIAIQDALEKATAADRSRARTVASAAESRDLALRRVSYQPTPPLSPGAAASPTMRRASVATHDAYATRDRTGSM
jgi:hypothetical protein